MLLELMRRHLGSAPREYCRKSEVFNHWLAKKWDNELK